MIGSEREPSGASSGFGDAVAVARRPEHCHQVKSSGADCWLRLTISEDGRSIKQLICLPFFFSAVLAEFAKPPPH
jgi:hypothetical protein